MNYESAVAGTLSMNRMLGKFSDGKHEQEYALAHLRDYRIRVTISLSLIGAAVLTFWHSDFLFAHSAQALIWLVATRIGLLGLTAAAAAFAWNVEDQGLHGWAMVAYVVLLAGAELVIDASRPEHYLVSFILAPMVVLGVFLVVPARLPYQIAAALFYSVARGLALLLTRHVPPAGAPLGIAFALLAANVLGYLGARRSHFMGRIQYAAAVLKRESLNALHQSLHSLKTLGGTITICAWCKNVREDGGTWQHVESYIGSVIHVEFNHGICPECLQIAQSQP